MKTEHVGRLLIYSKVLASSSILLNNVKYTHGFAVIPKELTSASGRGSNQVIEHTKSSKMILTETFIQQWLSPPGCLMFSLQLHIPLSSNLGQKISLIQHLVATAVVQAVQNLPGYEVSDERIK